MRNTLKITAAAVSVALIPASAQAADEPAHEVISEDGAFQLREYAPMILAEVEVAGSMAGAGNAGFRPLANYIFGGNQAREGGAAEIAMTTPVTQTRSQTIEMTTPVTQARAEDGVWRVAFVMPAEWSMDTLPVPDDASVVIREQAARRMAVVRFSGGANDARFQARESELRSHIQSQGWTVTGEAVYARYDPPWIPTPFRRNEVMIEVSADTGIR
jgi:hypothetical protein